MGYRRLMLGVALAAVAGCATPAVQVAGKVSRPGQYEGFATVAYDGVERSSIYVPMRDGTKLAVDIFRPTKDGVLAAEKLPVVWMHMPYNRRTYSGGPAVERYPGYAIQLVKYGYNVAIADFRGVYASYGRNTGYNRGEWVEAARFDAYDVTEWLAKQPYSTGKIGMWGCSATGGSQMQAATTRPPSLKAIMPMSAEFDGYSAFVIGGAAAPDVISTPGTVGRTASAGAMRDRAAAPVDGPDGARMLAEAVASHDRNIETPGFVPYRDSRSEAIGVPWWELSNPSAHLADLKASGIGVYAVANWDEAGTRHGAFFTKKNLPNTKLLVGPATHCAWSAVKDETGFDLVTEELRFYDYWLKGVKNGVMSEPSVTYYTYNAPRQTQWRTAKAWPLANEKRTDFYLTDGGLSAAKPVAPGQDAVALSPSAPAQSTTITAPTGGASYLTEPLTADMEITGHPVMHLWISTALADTDVLAKIDDVAPDGTARSYQMLGRLRASNRTLAKAPYDYMGLPWQSHRQADAKPLVAGASAELAFDLLPMSYIFKAGHRVRLTLTFNDPQRRDGASGQVTIHRSPAQMSYLTLPVIPAAR